MAGSSDGTRALASFFGLLKNDAGLKLRVRVPDTVLLHEDGSPAAWWRTGKDGAPVLHPASKTTLAAIQHRFLRLAGMDPASINTEGTAAAAAINNDNATGLGGGSNGGGGGGGGGGFGTAGMGAGMANSEFVAVARRQGCAPELLRPAAFVSLLASLQQQQKQQNQQHAQRQQQQQQQQQQQGGRASIGGGGGGTREAGGGVVGGGSSVVGGGSSSVAAMRPVVALQAYVAPFLDARYIATYMQHGGVAQVTVQQRRYSRTYSANVLDLEQLLDCPPFAHDGGGGVGSRNGSYSAAAAAAPAPAAADALEAGEMTVVPGGGSGFCDGTAGGSGSGAELPADGWLGAGVRRAALAAAQYLERAHGVYLSGMALEFVRDIRGELHLVGVPRLERARTPPRAAPLVLPPTASSPSPAATTTTTAAAAMGTLPGAFPSVSPLPPTASLWGGGGAASGGGPSALPPVPGSATAATAGIGAARSRPLSAAVFADNAHATTVVVQQHLYGSSGNSSSGVADPIASASASMVAAYRRRGTVAVPLPTGSSNSAAAIGDSSPDIDASAFLGVPPMSSSAALLPLPLPKSRPQSSTHHVATVNTAAAAATGAGTRQHSLNLPRANSAGAGGNGNGNGNGSGGGGNVGGAGGPLAAALTRELEACREQLHSQRQLAEALAWKARVLEHEKAVLVSAFERRCGDLEGQVSSLTSALGDARGGASAAAARGEGAEARAAEAEAACQGMRETLARERGAAVAAMREYHERGQALELALAEAQQEAARLAKAHKDEALSSGALRFQLEATQRQLSDARAALAEAASGSADGGHAQHAERAVALLEPLLARERDPRGERYAVPKVLRAFSRELGSLFLRYVLHEAYDPSHWPPRMALGQWVAFLRDADTAVGPAGKRFRFSPMIPLKDAEEIYWACAAPFNMHLAPPAAAPRAAAAAAAATPGGTAVTAITASTTATTTAATSPPMVVAAVPRTVSMADRQHDAALLTYEGFCAALARVAARAAAPNGGSVGGGRLPNSQGSGGGGGGQLGSPYDAPVLGFLSEKLRLLIAQCMDRCKRMQPLTADKRRVTHAALKGKVRPIHTDATSSSPGGGGGGAAGGSSPGGGATARSIAGSGSVSARGQPHPLRAGSGAAAVQQQ